MKCYDGSPNILENGDHASNTFVLSPNFQYSFMLVAYKMLRWVTKYTSEAVNIPGQPAQVKYMCGKHCFFWQSWTGIQ